MQQSDFERDILNDLEQDEEEQRLLEREQRMLDDMRTVMSTRPGRRLVFNMLDECNFFRSVLNSDVVLFSAAEGQRNVACWIYSMIDRSCPELYTQMLKESKEMPDDRRDTNDRNNRDDGNTVNDDGSNISG